MIFAWISAWTPLHLGTRAVACDLGDSQLVVLNRGGTTQSPLVAVEGQLVLWDWPLARPVGEHQATRLVNVARVLLGCGFGGSRWLWPDPKVS